MNKSVYLQKANKYVNQNITSKLAVKQPKSYFVDWSLPTMKQNKMYQWYVLVALI